MIALRALFARELLRLTRQPSRIVASVGTVALMWAFLAGGFAHAFAAQATAGESVALFLLPGMATAVVIFSSIFAAISLIQDRQSGLLQSALVSPAPAAAIAGAKCLAGALIATLQGAALFVLAPTLGGGVSLAGASLAIAALFLAAMGVSGVSLALAWKIESIEGFHGVMNLILMPMWLLSGAFFPVGSSAGWVSVLAHANPLFWATNCIRAAVAGGAPDALSWGLTGLFAVAAFALALVFIGKRRAE